MDQGSGGKENSIFPVKKALENYSPDYRVRVNISIHVRMDREIVFNVVNFLQKASLCPGTFFW